MSVKTILLEFKIPQGTQEAFTKDALKALSERMQGHALDLLFSSDNDTFRRSIFTSRNSVLTLVFCPASPAGDNECIVCTLNLEIIM